MGSRNPPLNLNSSLQAALEQAFDATWTVLQARNAFRDFDRDNELQTALSQTLATLSAEGVTDPIELREWALESLPRS
jgi:ABC-type branched-subunit amino acid transport system substrate-binding protein